MEEAEALSSKLAIMVEGKVKCIGPVQQLKSKYGQGFEIEAKIRLPTAEEVTEMKRMLGSTNYEDSIRSADKAIQILNMMGFQGAVKEFAEGGKCGHFKVQVA